MAVLVATSAVACSSEIEGKPKAKVEEAKPAAAKAVEAKAEAPAVTRSLKLDKTASSVGFVGAKITGDHKGGFEDFEGEATLAGDTISSLRVTVQMPSVTSDAADLTGHLKSADFFEVEKYPTAVFSADTFTAKPGEGATHEIAGTLELHGVKKAIQFPAKITVDAQGARGQAEFTINRKDFKIEYPGKPDDLIKDEVLLKLDLKFTGG